MGVGGVGGGEKTKIDRESRKIASSNVHRGGVEVDFPSLRGGIFHQIVRTICDYWVDMGWRGCGVGPRGGKEGQKRQKDPMIKKRRKNNFSSQRPVVDYDISS